MVRVAVLVSGGGTNLQAILDASAAGKLPHAELGKNTASISAPIPSVVTSSQWNIPVADNAANSVYSRVYDIPSQQTTFTNISIPIGFNSRCLRTLSRVDIIQ